jgi:hypothetical protein
LKIDENILKNIYKNLIKDGSVEVEDAVNKNK